MANFKRRKRRVGGVKGCGMCKFYKCIAAKGEKASQTWQERRARISEREQIDET